MRVSLSELINSGRDFPSVMPSAVHYSPEGHRRLAAMEADHFWFTERRALVFRLLKRMLPRGSSPLLGIDVGCGSGYTSVWLTENGLPTYGQDVYGGFQEYRKQRRGLGFVQGDITSVEPMAEFDFTLLLDVIEHIPDDQAFVNHVGKLLKPGGLLVITTPAFSWLWSNVDDSSGHLRRYTKHDLARFERLSDSHFRREFSSYFYGSTLPLYFASRLLSRFRSGTGTPEVEAQPPSIVNAAFKRLLRAEAAACLSIGVPVGSSLIAVLRKN